MLQVHIYRGHHCNAAEKVTVGGLRAPDFQNAQSQSMVGEESHDTWKRIEFGKAKEDPGENIVKGKSRITR